VSQMPLAPAMVNGQIVPVGLAQKPPATDPDLAPKQDATLPTDQNTALTALSPTLTAIVQTPRQGFEASIPVHQPLIQVKMRVVEVSRNDSLQVASVLDFIGLNPHPNSTLIKTNNINNNMRNVSGATRFSVVPPDLLQISGNTLSAGSGALVNLTTGNLNWIFSWLATEFHSDVLTAPEVVVLNQQTVELISGSKVPFLIGQNIVTGQGQNIQQFFYKHVGTYISVTPTIVNWGAHAEGSGKAVLQDSEVTNWKEFVSIVDERIKAKKMFLPNWPDTNAPAPIVTEAKSKALAAQTKADALKVDATKPNADPKVVAAWAALQAEADAAAAKVTTTQNQFEIYYSVKPPKLPLSSAAKGFVLNLLATYYSRSELRDLCLPICCKEGCTDCDWHAEDWVVSYSHCMVSR